MDFFENFVDILLWSLWFTIWIMFIFLIIRFVMDAWRDSGIGVFAKILWTLFLVLIPVIGALVYLLARGKGMAERDMAAAQDLRAAQVEYTKGLMGDAGPSGPAGEIKAAKELLDAGAISPEEFAHLKSKALS